MFSQTRLRELRITAGYTQQEIADKTGLTRPAVSLIERGEQRITAEALADWVAACGAELAIIRDQTSSLYRLQTLAEELNPGELALLTEFAGLLPRLGKVEQEMWGSMIGALKVKNM